MLSSFLLSILFYVYLKYAEFFSMALLSLPDSVHVCLFLSTLIF